MIPWTKILDDEITEGCAISLDTYIASAFGCKCVFKTNKTKSWYSTVIAWLNGVVSSIFSHILMTGVWFWSSIHQFNDKKYSSVSVSCFICDIEYFV